MADEKNTPKAETKAAPAKLPDASPAPAAPAATPAKGPSDNFKFLTHCGQFAKDTIATGKEILAKHPNIDLEDLLTRNVIKKHRIEE